MPLANSSHVLHLSETPCCALPVFPASRTGRAPLNALLSCAAAPHFEPLGVAPWHRRKTRRARPPRRSVGRRPAGAASHRYGVKMAQALEDEAAARAFLTQPGPRAVVFAVNSLALVRVDLLGRGVYRGHVQANRTTARKRPALGAASSLVSLRWTAARAARRRIPKTLASLRAARRTSGRVRRLRGDGDGGWGITRRRRRRGKLRRSWARARSSRRGGFGGLRRPAHRGPAQGERGRARPGKRRRRRPQRGGNK